MPDAPFPSPSTGGSLAAASTIEPDAVDSATADSATADPATAELSYEAARDELVRVVAELEQGAATLEQSLALWERGEALARRCEDWLIGARARIEAARSGAAGSGDGSGGATSR